VQRAFHIAQGEAERRYARVSPLDDRAWEEGGDADYFGNTSALFHEVLKDMQE